MSAVVATAAAGLGAQRKCGRSHVGDIAKISRLGWSARRSEIR